MRRTLLLALAPALALLPAAAADPEPPAVPREFRGVWVATVANIDWPSRRGLPPEQQQDELKAILDKCVEVGLNAVVFQVRPMADALYKSDLEPWSEFLTGTAGKDPGYDPLEFAVREAHARGLELHAWFNPYRAWHPSAHSPVPDNHVVKTHPELAPAYGKHHWLNPTNPRVQDLSAKVFADVVRRYDVDGIHIDDYFYPYKEKDDAGKTIPFPDDDTWEAYQSAGAGMSRDDWRRAAVNKFVERMYRETKAVKPWVKVGISPFGIGRPGRAPGIKGFDQYAELYADSELWLRNGWVDYWTPQLYWPIAKKEQSFPVLLDWWASVNVQKRHLWPGLATFRLPPAEIVEQIKLTRKLPGAPGHVHFSMKQILHNKDGIADALKEVYGGPALVPASPWLDRPAKPDVKLTAADGGFALTVRPAAEGARQVVVRSLDGGKWTVRILAAPADGGKQPAMTFPKEPERVQVTVVNRVGVESEAAEVGK